MFAALFQSPFFKGIFFSALFLFAVYCPAQAGGSAPEPHSVAMRNFGVWEPQTKERLDFTVWYPTRGEVSTFVREGWIVTASQSGRILPGFYPIVLVSHDTASGRFANNDLAAALAAGGMIVIVPSHTGDNQNFSNGIYTAKLVRERPRHLLRALDTVLGTPEFAPHADESRIGLLGIGFGSVTVMQLAGATPDFTRLQGYCESAAAQDAFCASWAKDRLERIDPEIRHMLSTEGNTALSPPLDLFAPPLVPAPVPEQLETSDPHTPSAALQEANPSLWRRIFGGGSKSQEADTQNSAPDTPEANPPSELSENITIIQDLKDIALFGSNSQSGDPVTDSGADSPFFRFSAEDIAPADPNPSVQPVILDPSRIAYRRNPDVRKISGIALLAPAGGMLFSPESLTKIHVPVAVVEAGSPFLYPPEQHAGPYFSSLPMQPMVLQAAKADIFSLFASCDRDTEQNLSDICGKVFGEARQDLAAKRDAFLVPFFQSALGGALPPAMPSGYTAAESPEE